MKIDLTELNAGLERLNQILAKYKPEPVESDSSGEFSSESILELISDEFTDIDQSDCEEYFDAIENPCDKATHLLAIMDQCKLFAADNDSRAEKYSQIAKLWERRFQELQRYGIRLLNETKTKSLESDDYIMGLEQEMPEIKCSITRRYSTDNMIPDELIFSIPENYRKPKIIWEMRSDCVKDALLSGKKLNFAKLVDKQRLRIINKSEETL